jgi:ectoine hydroxylase-related dioxygenase (phytanoyl-CoA dioxygenase family)
VTTQAGVLLAHLSDVGEGGGGTVVVPRSHHEVWGHLAASGPLQHNALNRHFSALMTARPAWPREPVQLAGRTGEVTLMHRFLLHTGSANADLYHNRPRVMLNATIFYEQQR